MTGNGGPLDASGGPNLPALDSVGAVGRLWRVEQSFRRLETDLRARPIVHQKRDSIEAHEADRGSSMRCTGRPAVVISPVRLTRHGLENACLAIRRRMTSCVRSMFPPCDTASSCSNARTAVVF